MKKLAKERCRPALQTTLLRKLVGVMCLSVLLISTLQAQSLESYELGLNPSKMRWQQIKTDKVQVIFPKGLEASAQRVANLVTFLSDSTNISLGKTSGRVSIILQNQTTIPNGFVSLVPFRSEFFMTAPQFNFLGSANWADLLTIHEYRHIKQFRNSQVGLTKLASILFGQNGWAFMSGTALPRWYLEGDAVSTETALTSSGRGRVPYFDMEYRALRLEGKHYNYEKASAGSLKDFVPSHYHLGYNMIAYGRKQFGTDIWGKVMVDASKYRGLFYPFSHSLKVRTGLRTKDLYSETMTYLDSLYKADEKILALTPAKQVSAGSEKVVTNYRNAHFINDEQIIVEKDAYNEIRTYYLIDADGTETRLFSPGLNFDLNSTLSVADGVLTWSELTFHSRWFEKNYSIIRSYNLRGFDAESKVGQQIKGFKPEGEDRSFAMAYESKREKVTAKSKYFAPDLSADAKKIVAVHIPSDLKCELVILNTQPEDVIQTLENPEGWMFAFPQWMPNQKDIVVVARNATQSALVKINVASGQTTFLTDWTTEQISNPFPSGDYVFFAGSFTGINNIFAVKVGDKQIYQVTSTQLGAFQPSVSPNGKKLIYSEFSSLGYQLMQTEVDPSSWKKVITTTPNILSLYKPLVEQEGQGDILERIPDKEYEVKKYSKLSGLVNLHSWNPIISDPFNAEGGVQATFANKISTFSAVGGYVYNANEKAGRIFAEAAYGEFWPIIRVGISESEREFARIFDVTTDDGTTIDTGFVSLVNDYDEQIAHVGVTLPFNLTKGRFLTNLELMADYQRIETDFEERSLSNVVTSISPSLDTYFADHTFSALSLEASFSTFQTTAVQHILPRLGFAFSASHRTTLGSDAKKKGKVNYMNARLFLPGFAKTHNLYFFLANQSGESVTDTYKFVNRFPASRGYGTPFFSEGLTRFSVNYTLPLFYPDKAVGSLAFFKRVKANFFYDYTSVTGGTVDGLPFSQGLRFLNRQQRSFGVELSTDFRALRLLEIDLGVRFSYLQDSANTTQVDFLLFRIGV